MSLENIFTGGSCHYKETKIGHIFIKCEFEPLSIQDIWKYFSKEF